MLINFIFTLKAIKSNKVLSAEQANYFGRISEYIECQEDIKTNGRLNFLFSSFYKINKKLFQITRKASYYNYGILISTTFIFSFLKIIFLIISGYLFFANQITIGSIYLILYYLSMIEGPIEEIRAELAKFQKANASVMRIKNLFEEKNNFQISDNSKEIDKKDFHSLCFKNVSFGYGESLVLDDISFSLNNHEIIGIVGSTGAGKTTLVNLIFRFIDVNKGGIYINNTNIMDINLEILRNNITYIPQDVDIFEASLKDNITMFKNDISDDDIIDITKEIGIYNWYERISKNHQSNISKKTLKMSEGEEQLIAILRAFIKNSPIIIFDEITSNIDGYTEELIKNALKKILIDKTGIIISHKLKMLDITEKIIFLENGKIIENEKYQVLLNNNDSEFNKLINH
jgi:ABC-type multidrug transport system fused ATPase/permease subunit